MPKRPQPAQDSQEQALLDLLTELDRCEELLEEMAELGVSSVDDVERRIAELNAKIDTLPEETPAADGSV